VELMREGRGPGRATRKHEDRQAFHPL
jgi:hypothetical protein